jgi:hypothetical protein
MSNTGVRLPTRSNQTPQSSRPHTDTGSLTSAAIYQKYSKFLEPSLISIKPNPIIFTEYETDREFEQQFEVQNVSHNIIMVRIGKPQTKYFSVSYLAKADAPIAPGMSCKFLVKFKPNHLSDFDDYIEVITNDTRTKLELLGRRPHPVLTLPRIMNCGFCYVDTETTTQYQVANTGSAGLFRFLSTPGRYFPKKF